MTSRHLRFSLRSLVGSRPTCHFLIYLSSACHSSRVVVIWARLRTRRSPTALARSRFATLTSAVAGWLRRRRMPGLWCLSSVLTGTVACVPVARQVPRSGSAAGCVIGDPFSWTRRPGSAVVATSAPGPPAVTGLPSAVATLLAGFALLHFAGTIRSVLGRFASTVASSVQLARVASAGAVVGAAGIAMAIVMVAAATVREPTRIRS